MNKEKIIIKPSYTKRKIEQLQRENKELKEREGYCYQEYEPTPNKPCEIKTRVVGKNLLDKEPKLTGQKIPNIIGITELQYYEYEKLQQENKQLKDGWQQEVNHKDEILNNWLELQQRIYKAIEYIEENILINFDKVGFNSDIIAGIVVNKLLEILKGE